jgi:ketosteroid isomerase-like protein
MSGPTSTQTEVSSMKRLILSIVLLLFASCLVFGQAKQTAVQNAVQEITALENAWNAAMQKHDASFYERNMADSTIGTDEDGVVMDKATFIANAKKSVSKIELPLFEKFKVQVYGDTAVATGVNILKGTNKGKDISGKYPFTDTWIKLGGRWQCVASHNSKMPSK